MKLLRKNAKNDNDVKTAARAQWLHETKERNKSFALTLNSNLCFAGRKKWDFKLYLMSSFTNTNHADVFEEIFLLIWQ